MAQDFLDTKVTELRSRLGELRDETRRIEQALSALEGAGGRRRPGRPRGSSSTKAKPAARGRGRRSRKGGTRSEHTQRLLAEKPGLTVAEIAKGLSIKPNYVYRVLAEMDKDGLIRRDGRQVFLK